MDADLSRAQWRKSSYSGSNGNCVEVARNLTGIVAIRDSKNTDGPILLSKPEQWRVFIETYCRAC